MILFRCCVTLVCLACSGAALADTDCDDAIANWKPRETLRQEVQAHGWTVQRIKVDDGCYEVRATDRLGNRVKAKYAPETLRIRSLEVEFGPAGDASDYLPPARPGKAQQGAEMPATKGKRP